MDYDKNFKIIIQTSKVEKLKLCNKDLWKAVYIKKLNHSDKFKGRTI